MFLLQQFWTEPAEERGHLWLWFVTHNKIKSFFNNASHYSVQWIQKQVTYQKLETVQSFSYGEHFWGKPKWYTMQREEFCRSELRKIAPMFWNSIFQKEHLLSLLNLIDCNLFLLKIRWQCYTSICSQAWSTWKFGIFSGFINQSISKFSPTLFSVHLPNLFKLCLFCFVLSQKLAPFTNILTLSFAKNRLPLGKDHKDLKNIFSALCIL